MEKIAISLIGQDNQKYQTMILDLEKKLNVDLVFINESSPFNQAYQLGQMVLTQKVNRGIIIDDFGSLPFMVVGKMKNSVVAQISDEHSAHMTSEHNGANVIVIGSHLTGSETIKNIITKYLTTPFAAGRHVVRTDMLCEMLKFEGDVN